MRPSTFIFTRAWLLLCLLTVASASTAATHLDMMVQQEDGKLVTGLAELSEGAYSIGAQVYSGSLLSSNRASDPGYFSLAEGNPNLPAEALPADSDLYWDFLPMSVGATVSNLFYWDGLDDNLDGLSIDDVEFDRPDNEQFYMVSNGFFAADASDQMVPGGVIDTTAFDGSIHKHPAYILDTSDASTPDTGIYMISMQVRMDGLETSEPYFLLMRTSTLGDDTLEVATDWVEGNLEMLTGGPTLPGDYNGDGLVDLGDYTVWRDSLGSTTDLAANGDNTGTSQGIIDVADYEIWKVNFGTSLNPIAAVETAVVPEPGSGSQLLIAVLVGSVLFGSRVAGFRRSAARPQS
ncbi:hypothetical protein [Aeoliella mucimassa]|uniref:PEP-CTERM protein-sorting domain-containing protein n=1 Tax=Aeoliella mucimassa TaxID=2527972 RepID=A0A518AJJ5_9BACT|nr:hypothetical protein [Aeoliella mucimassa]QDU54902.1 hypothetical protein Pan181_10870 [Aeoliella mucimassa]